MTAPPYSESIGIFYKKGRIRVGLKRWNRFKLYLTGTILLVCMGAALLYAHETEDGITRGIAICTQTLIPSLFPFLFLSSFLVRSGACTAAGQWAGRITQFLFRLPGSCAGVILMGLLGGYPVGISMAEELMQRGEITRSQAQRLSLFCVDAGPAFTIAAVGAGMMGSAHTGVLLYASGVVSVLAMGVAVRFLPERAPVQKQQIRPVEPLPLTDAMTTAVSSSVKAMVNICAWVLLFCAAGNLIRLIPMPGAWYDAITYVLEISSGCAAAAHRAPPAVLSAMLSFSGLCVICQLTPGARRCGGSMWQLLLSRAVSAAVSGTVCALLCRMFPSYIQTAAGFEPLYHAGLSVSIPACAALLFMGLVVINEVDIKRKT